MTSECVATLLPRSLAPQAHEAARGTLPQDYWHFDPTACRPLMRGHTVHQAPPLVPVPSHQLLPTRGTPRWWIAATRPSSAWHRCLTIRSSSWCLIDRNCLPHTRVAARCFRYPRRSLGPLRCAFSCLRLSAPIDPEPRLPLCLTAAQCQLQISSLRSSIANHARLRPLLCPRADYCQFQL